MLGPHSPRDTDINPLPHPRDKTPAGFVSGPEVLSQDLHRDEIRG